MWTRIVTRGTITKSTHITGMYMTITIMSSHHTQLRSTDTSYNLQSTASLSTEVSTRTQKGGTFTRKMSTTNSVWFHMTSIIKLRSNYSLTKSTGTLSSIHTTEKTWRFLLSHK